MLVERLSFQANYGQGDALIALFREMANRMRQEGMGEMRLYTDATGDMFTVQVEGEFADWQAYAKFQSQSEQMFGDSQFQEWFGRMVPLVEKGSRQLFNVQKP
jgi:hypothetical protein